ncbi:hypothetical protein GUJ93_ZPchr0001g31560 [Zizania palustris]|uniref:Uncharacterized protein n=1 Tax=Zizania palustris TaxID=103762 RepID=A0A8J5V8Q2_ZIZPA|nr:hypothetical protein GUJ93_ZPchr0001g31560 [Zizania palustris]
MRERDWATLMCIELADQRGSRGGGGRGRPAKGGGDDYHGARAAEAMTVAAGAAELMSGNYQAQEMSTMVSALARVVAGGDPWAAAAAEVPAWAAYGGGGVHEKRWEEQAMCGHACTSWGAPRPRRHWSLQIRSANIGILLVQTFRYGLEPTYNNKHQPDIAELELKLSDYTKKMSNLQQLVQELASKFLGNLRSLRDSYTAMAAGSLSASNEPSSVTKLSQTVNLR